MAGCVSVLPGDITTRHTSRVYVCARKMCKGNYTSVAFKHVRLSRDRNAELYIVIAYYTLQWACIQVTHRRPVLQV